MVATIEVGSHGVHKHNLGIEARRAGLQLGNGAYQMTNQIKRHPIRKDPFRRRAYGAWEAKKKDRGERYGGDQVSGMD